MIMAYNPLFVDYASSNEKTGIEKPHDLERTFWRNSSRVISSDYGGMVHKVSKIRNYATDCFPLDTATLHPRP
jgi:hypothetical protein